MLRDIFTDQALLQPNVVAAPLIVNEGFFRYEALTAVESSQLNAPPIGPHQQGRAFLFHVDDGVTDPQGWTGMLDSIVFWYGNQWRSIYPTIGTKIYCVATGRVYQADSSGFSSCISGTYDIGSMGSGTIVVDPTEWTTLAINCTASFTLSASVSVTHPGRIYTILIVNTTGATKTITLNSGTWIYTTSSISLPDDIVLAIRFTRAYTTSRFIILSVGAAAQYNPI